MPKRSNDFQRLVALVQSQLAGESVVTESDMVRSISGGPPREVDVTIRFNHGTHQVVVAVEVVAYKRRATVEWVERMVGKHQDLATDKLILYSASGFTENARRRAANSGTELVDRKDLQPSTSSPLGGRETLQLVRRGHQAVRWQAVLIGVGGLDITVELNDNRDFVHPNGTASGLRTKPLLAKMGELYRTQLGNYGRDAIAEGATLPFLRTYRFPPPRVQDDRGNELPLMLCGPEPLRPALAVREFIGEFLHYSLAREVPVEYSKLGEHEVASISDALPGASIRLLASGRSGDETFTVQWEDESPITHAATPKTHLSPQGPVGDIRG